MKGWQEGAPRGGLAHLFKDPKEDICVERPLVRFIHDDGTVLIQVAFSEGLSQQHAISHVLDEGVWPSHILKADCVSHLYCQNSSMTENEGI